MYNVAAHIMPQGNHLVQILSNLDIGISKLKQRTKSQAHHGPGSLRFWRRRMGVEPTRDSDYCPADGFEDREAHRDPSASPIGALNSDATPIISRPAPRLQPVA